MKMINNAIFILCLAFGNEITAQTTGPQPPELGSQGMSPINAPSAQKTCCYNNSSISVPALVTPFLAWDQPQNIQCPAPNEYLISIWQYGDKGGVVSGSMPKKIFTGTCATINIICGHTDITTQPPYSSSNCQ